MQNYIMFVTTQVCSFYELLQLICYVANLFLILEQWLIFLKQSNSINI